jgi:hypothetical protein
MTEGLDLYLGVDKAGGFVARSRSGTGNLLLSGPKLLDRLAASLAGMSATKSTNTVLTMLLAQRPPFVPSGTEAMTIRIDLPPGDPVARRTVTPGRCLATCWKAR